MISRKNQNHAPIQTRPLCAMADWFLLGKALTVTILPCLVLLYTLVTRTSISTPPSTPSSCLPRLPTHRRVILVTGSAGFIGYHVSRTLVDQWHASVVGVDSYTDYYDIQIKYDRTYELMKLGVRMYRGDLCDRTMLSYLFDKYGFTHVVHMAAQAGVRHSLEKPLEYTHNNVECFLTLLDVLKDHQNVSLVYASSSSVYGRDASLPFSISSPLQPPTNIYAALKVSSERFANAYCSQHSIRSIGLRLFTVYGPWGRPDMAVYKFTHRLANQKPVPIFNSPKPLLRDFTFINDTVGGVLAALNHTPCSCGEVYNIGSGRPMTLDRLLEYLESELNLTAQIELLPLPPSDLFSTWADISDTTRALNFIPQISLGEGVKEFIQWYKSYHSKRQQLEGSGQLVVKNKQIEEFLLEGELEIASAHRLQLDERNVEYRGRMSSLRNKYTEFALTQERALPNMDKREFIFFPGVDSPGSTVIKAPGYRDNIKLLEQRCLKTEQCIAFNSRGEFKSHLQPKQKWKSASNDEGLYVTDINMCSSDLHQCDKHADCIHHGPSNYSCVCHSGYVQLGRSCVEKFIDGVTSEKERQWQLSNQLDGIHWDQMIDGKQFIFFQGLDSPGGDYLVVEGGAGDGVRLEGVCHRTHRCVAFNTNGILKQWLRPPHKWIRWTDHPEHGLYVLDVDYCSLAMEHCPSHAHCIRHAPANYSCSCDPPFVMSHDHQCVRDFVHVIVSVDEDHFPGMVGVVNSTLSHTSHPESIQFHIVLSNAESATLREYLSCYGLNTDQLDVVQIDPSFLRGRVRVYSSVERVGNLASLANFGRFLFHEIFPDLQKAIYLDADTVVLGDIIDFWRQLETTDQLLLAAPRQRPRYGEVFKPAVKQLFRERYGYEFGDSDPTFNAGVYGVNFDLWRKNNLHNDVMYWMNQQYHQPLWSYGTQPIMLLIAHRQWAELDPLWNINGLGWNTELNRRSLSTANLLHWSGKRKPWLSDGLYSDLWLAHVTSACSGRGRCVSNGSGYHCQCHNGYHGNQCRLH